MARTVMQQLHQSPVQWCNNCINHPHSDARLPWEHNSCSFLKSTTSCDSTSSNWAILQIPKMNTTPVSLVMLYHVALNLVILTHLRLTANNIPFARGHFCSISRRVSPAIKVHETRPLAEWKEKHSAIWSYCPKRKPNRKDTAWYVIVIVHNWNTHWLINLVLVKHSRHGLGCDFLWIAIVLAMLNTNEAILFLT